MRSKFAKQAQSRNGNNLYDCAHCNSMKFAAGLRKPTPPFPTPPQFIFASDGRKGLRAVYRSPLHNFHASMNKILVKVAKDLRGP